MPELPEVETIRAGLNQLIGWKITRVFRSQKQLRRDSKIDFQHLVGMKVQDVKRRARYLLIELTNSKHKNLGKSHETEGLTMIIHLGMSGRISISDQKVGQKLDLKALNSGAKNLSFEKHDHFVCQFFNRKLLIFNDPRRFGFVEIVKNSAVAIHPNLKTLGCEPLSEEFNEKYLQESLRGKKINIKTVMMDNKIVVGVGNIYINESLFAAQISPLKEAGSLNSSEIKKIVAKIKETIGKAIEMGGSSISDYRNANGEFGNFQTIMRVYGRGGLPCMNCSELVLKIVQNGRSTFFCKICQK